MATNDIFSTRVGSRPFAMSASTQVASIPRKIARVPEHARKRPLTITGAVDVEPQVAPGIFPVVENPKFVFAAASRFRTEEQIIAACAGAGPLPFLLSGSVIYSLSPLTSTSEFGAALERTGTPSRQMFAEWLSDPQRSEGAIELLDRSLRRHAWKRGLHFEESHALFYFTRSRSKNLWWEFCGTIAQREVTAPLMQSYQIEDGRIVDSQRGWKHEAIRAGFVFHEGRLCLRFEPSWLLTELDGKTPATNETVKPVGAQSVHSEAEFLCALRFWSAVFAKSHRELRMETGAGPIRVRLTPTASPAPRIIPKDRLDLEDLSAAIEKNQLIPELSPAPR